MTQRSSGRLFVVVLVLALASGSFLSTTPAATRTKIKTDWVTFFAGTTSVKQKIALLQNGQSFAGVIKSQASSPTIAPLAKSVTATVASVTLTSATKAKVKYSLDLGGKPALSNQTGIAVLQKGTWKVGDQSFCALLALEGTTAPGCPKG
ncbi:MAG TPA: hypothetical protein VN786_08370 [Acidimicrobiales bacterium]|nr:hypothetical protein [Acidimicrobiales bacterium]